MRPVVNVTVGGQEKPSNYTYKTVILKSSLPFAEQVTEPNCIYVIKWDYDLGGETVTIPENCILDFQGGSIANGTLESEYQVGLCGNPKMSAIELSLDITDSTVIHGMFDSLQEEVDYCVAYNKNLDLKGDTITIGSPIAINRRINESSKLSNFVIFNGTLIGSIAGEPLFTSTLSVTRDRPVSQYIKFENVVFKSSLAENQPYVLDKNKFIRVNSESCTFDSIRFAKGPERIVEEGEAKNDPYFSSIYFLNCIIQKVNDIFFEGYQIYHLCVDNVNMQGCPDGAFAKFILVVGSKIINSVFEDSKYVLTYQRAFGLSIENNYFESLSDYVVKGESDNTFNDSRGVVINNNYCCRADYSDPNYAYFIWPPIRGGQSEGNATLPDIETGVVNRHSDINNEYIHDLLDRNFPYSEITQPRVYVGSIADRPSRIYTFNLARNIPVGTLVVDTNAFSDGNYPKNLPIVSVCKVAGNFDDAVFVPIAGRRITAYSSTRPPHAESVNGDTYLDAAIEKQRPVWFKGGRWVDANGYGAGNSWGATTSRPMPNPHGPLLPVDIGFTYFDTTLGKPIYLKEILDPTFSYSCVWVDFAGAVMYNIIPRLGHCVIESCTLNGGDRVIIIKPEEHYTLPAALEGEDNYITLNGRRLTEDTEYTYEDAEEGKKQLTILSSAFTGNIIIQITAEAVES